MRIVCFFVIPFMVFCFVCVTAEAGSSSVTRQYNMNSRLVYNTVNEILEKEKIPIAIVDTGEPRIIITGYIYSKKLDRDQRYKYKFIVGEIDQEITKVEVASFWEYFDDFWKNEWRPMRSDKKHKEQLLNKVDKSLKEKNT